MLGLPAIFSTGFHILGTTASWFSTMSSLAAKLRRRFAIICHLTFSGVLSRSITSSCFGRNAAAHALFMRGPAKQRRHSGFWCFLQRHDLDGIFDMENSVIHQDFPEFHTESVWLKMTIGSFRLIELVSLYEAQGWTVKPFLVHRDLVSVYRSLRGKPYGFDGATGGRAANFHTHSKGTSQILRPSVSGTGRY